MNRDDLLKFAVEGGAPLFASPFGIEVDGKRFDCATDGRTLVAVVDGTSPLAPADKIDPGIPKLLTSSPGLFRLDVRLARVWAGTAQWSGKRACSNCHGSKRCTPSRCEDCGADLSDNMRDHQCGACAGSGSETYTPEVRLGAVRSRGLVVCIDLNRVAQVLTLVGDAEPVTVRIGGELDPVIFDGDGWRAVIMPIKPGDDAERTEAAERAYDLVRK